MTSMTMQDFTLMMKNQDLAILDIRDTTDFEKGHLKNALSLPATSLPNHLANLDKNTTYYVLSYSGRRSEIIAKFLENQGFTAVHVIGGMRALINTAA